MAPRAWVQVARSMDRHRLFDRQVTIEDMVRELEKVAAEQAGLDLHTDAP